jgi:type III pantothenate kinase
MNGTLIAVDIGNARIKLGRFHILSADRYSTGGIAVPEPQDTLTVGDDADDLDSLATWLHRFPSPLAGEGLAAKGEALSQSLSDPVAWYIGSVNRPSTTRLLNWLREHRPQDEVTLLVASDLELEVRLERPDMVGIDRLLDALAANRLRRPDHAAVVVDVGSAVTVDLLSADGAFCGGAILPGLAMAARAMHEFTDLLPLVTMAELSDPPPALGLATVSAMRSGLFWGIVGAIRELTCRLADGAPVDLFLTGGAGPAVAGLLGPDARHVPHLTLAGTAIAAGKLR